MVVAVRTPVSEELVPVSEELDDLRASWVGKYRRSHPVADSWARGLRRVSHSIETQERVFRMAEQLGRHGVEPIDVFRALEVADRCVALSDNPHAAAEAGYRAICTLVALAQDSVVICADWDRTNLRAMGFDPLPFDGHDPAAYAWVMFELTARRDAEHGCECCRSCFPMPIGLARL